MSTAESTVITDRTAIADLIDHTLAQLDQHRSEYGSALDAVQTAIEVLDATAAEYADKASEALATGWFTVEGLAAQGHRSPKRARARKPKTNSAATEIGRQEIPELIDRMLSELDQVKQRLDGATNDRSDAVSAAERTAAAYSARIASALATGWFTVEGLAGQGHRLPKHKRPRSPRATTPEAPAPERGQAGEENH